MKANELMVGDWVDIKATNSFIYKRRKITANDLIDSIHRECVYIPLTAEILEKNGFSCVVTKGEIAPSIGNFQLDNHWQGEDFSWHQIPMLYVHTLQHALRLCGIDKEIVL